MLIVPFVMVTGSNPFNSNSSPFGTPPLWPLLQVHITTYIAVQIPNLAALLGRKEQTT